LLFRWWADIAIHKRDQKKVVYMELVSSLSDAVRVTALLVDPRQPVPEAREKFATSLSALVSAQVVARLPLSKALTAIHSTLLRLNQAMHFERATLDPLHDAYVFLQERFKGCADEIDRRITELETSRVVEPLDVAKHDRLAKLIDEKVAQREKIREALIAKGKEAAEQVALCCKSLADGMQVYPVLITSVLREIRKELGFAFDDKEFLELQEQANRLSQNLMNDSISELRRRNGIA
jgi:hypothetical protein